MPSPFEFPYATIIKALQVGSHSVTVPAADPQNDWQTRFTNAGHAPLWEEIFRGQNEVRIIRDALLHPNHNSNERRCAEILLWAYPSNQHNIPTALLPFLGQVHAHAEAVAPWDEYFDEFLHIPGINVSTITKLAYFYGRTFDNHPALILDRRLIKCLPRWEGLAVPGLTYNTAYRLYPQYLTAMHAAGNHLETRPERIELFLFLMGDSF